MKKKILIFVSIFVISFILTGCKTQEEVIPFDATQVKQKINAYIFTLDACPICAEAKTFFGTLAEEYKDCFELIEYEVSNPENAIKDEAAREMFSVNEGGVPLIVIGDKHFLGYHNSFNSEIIDELVISCTSDTYKDLINPIEEE